MNDLEKAIQVLREGGIVIFPTDTAYGIGCRIDDTHAVDRLFQLRQRPVTKAMPVLVGSIDMALTYFKSPSPMTQSLMKSYWPGGLTIIDTCKKNLLHSPIRGGGETIGLRMPDHEMALALIQGLGIPVTGSSANFHGLPTPYSFEELDPNLTSKVDFVVKGDVKSRLVSTVIDCSVRPPQIVRQGAVKMILV